MRLLTKEIHCFQSNGTVANDTDTLCLGHTNRFCCLLRQRRLLKHFFKRRTRRRVPYSQDQWMYRQQFWTGSGCQTQFPIGQDLPRTQYYLFLCFANSNDVVRQHSALRSNFCNKVQDGAVHHVEHFQVWRNGLDICGVGQKSKGRDECHCIVGGSGQRH